MKNSKISWTNHTFNPWIGCTKVSEGCKNCYAEEQMDHRYHLAKWGSGHPRHRTAPQTWNEVRRWHRAALASGFRQRVFTASLADVFDPEVPAQWRADLLSLVFDCHGLDFLFLTKRPHLIMEQMEGALEFLPLDSELTPRLRAFLSGLPFDNIWWGTTIENQDAADVRLEPLLNVPGYIHFASCEPLLGPVNLRRVALRPEMDGSGTFRFFDALNGLRMVSDKAVEVIEEEMPKSLDWVIVGGESGAVGEAIRPMHPDWARSLKAQCRESTTHFLFKQWGAWIPHDQLAESKLDVSQAIDQWQFSDGTRIARFRGKESGKVLDGYVSEAIPNLTACNYEEPVL